MQTQNVHQKMTDALEILHHTQALALHDRIARYLVTCPKRNGIDVLLAILQQVCDSLAILNKPFLLKQVQKAIKAKTEQTQTPDAGRTRVRSIRNAADRAELYAGLARPTPGRKRRG